MAANVRLVDLDTPAETAARQSHHCTPHLVEPGPCCLVASQAQDTLETQGTPSELLIRHEPHSLKPCSQRLPRTFEDRSRNRRRLPLTCRAPKLTPGRYTSSAPLACGAAEAVRPSKSSQIVNAGCLRQEPLVEFLQRSRVVHPTDWMVIFAHLSILHLRERSGYPLLPI